MSEGEAVPFDENMPSFVEVKQTPVEETKPPPEGNIIQPLRKCLKCPKVFDNPKKLASHVYHVHGRIFYQCTLCNNIQRKPGRLKTHLIRKHHVVQNCTSKYMKRFYEYDKVIRPIKPENNESSSTAAPPKTLYFKKRTLSLMRCFNCYDCPLSFTNVRELFRHVKIHKSIKHEID